MRILDRPHRYCSHLRKGTQVYVEGTPEVRTYQKNDGSFGASLTLRVFNIQLLGSRNDGGNNNSGNEGGYPQQQRESVPAASDITEPIDDLPF